MSYPERVWQIGTFKLKYNEMTYIEDIELLFHHDQIF